jgi:hypothetical protein
MHQISHPLHRRAFAIRTAALGLAALASNAALAQAATAEKPKRLAPAELNAFPAQASWSLMGNGALRFFGFKAYDAYLWSGEQSANPLLSKTLFALEIDYATAIKADEITNVSLDLPRFHGQFRGS